MAKIERQFTNFKDLMLSRVENMRLSIESGNLSNAEFVDKMTALHIYEWVTDIHEALYENDELINNTGIASPYKGEKTSFQEEIYDLSSSVFDTYKMQNYGNTVTINGEEKPANMILIDNDIVNKRIRHDLTLSIKEPAMHSFVNLYRFMATADLRNFYEFRNLIPGWINECHSSYCTKYVGEEIFESFKETYEEMMRFTEMYRQQNPDFFQGLDTYNPEDCAYIVAQQENDEQDMNL